ncbi:MAG: hypothetical protein ACLR3R_19460 [Clostridium paraputrificum]
MKTFIRRVLKSMNILTVLKEYEVKSYLTYYRMDFRDSYNNYIVFDIFFNETDLFSEELRYIGSGKDYSLSDVIRSRCKVIGNLKSYLNYKKALPSVEDLNKFFEDGMTGLVDKILDIKVQDIIVRKVSFYTFPTLMIFIHLNYKLVRIPVIKIFIGEEINMDYNPSVNLFIEQVRRVLYV